MSHSKEYQDLIDAFIEKTELFELIEKALKECPDKKKMVIIFDTLLAPQNVSTVYGYPVIYTSIRSRVQIGFIA